MSEKLIDIKVQILAKYGTLLKFCEAYDLNYNLFTAKLRGVGSLSYEDIKKVVEGLELTADEIVLYFFT